MSRWISGRDLVKRWDLPPGEIAERFIKEGALLPYDKKGRDVSLDEVSDKIHHLRFNRANALALEKGLQLGRKKAVAKAVDKHPRARHKSNTIAVARELWAKKDTAHLTTPEMARHHDVKAAARKENGKLYAHKTIKSWIKEFNPNPPLKGAPSKKKK